MKNKPGHLPASTQSDFLTQLSARSALSLAVAALVGAALPLSAQALEIDYRLKGTLTGVADGGRDLGLSGADPTHEAYVDVSPWLHLRYSENWAAFARVRAFAPTGELLQPGNDNNNVAASDKAFIGLKEAWIEYGGLTSYPGEVLRLGRQRIRGDDAQYFDQDIDALRWIFDTTLLDAELGVARQFDTYRSDNVDVSREQTQRSYAFGGLAYDWKAQQRIGLRLLHARDDNWLPPAGAAVDSHVRQTRGDQTWIGLYADNHPYDWRNLQPLSYWVSVNALTGSRDRLQIDATDPAAPVSAGLAGEDVNAWAAEGGVRAQVAGPLQAGAAYAWSSGGDAGEQYEQSGVQSNYSRFTGTRAQIYRFNDAYRPEIGNLQVATAFVSAAHGAYDASLVYNHFSRSDAGAPVISDGLIVAPTQDSKDLGNGYDIVLSRYFSIGSRSEVPDYTPDETGDSAVRLRASVFDPGSAYGPAADPEYRVLLELSLWY